MIEAMYEDGIRTFIEVGPRYTLTKLAGQILRRKKDVQLISLNAGSQEGLFAFLNGLGQLSTWLHLIFGTLGRLVPQDPASAPKMKMKIP